MDDWSVQFYLNLESEIRRLEGVKHLYESNIYNQTLSTHIAYSADKGVHVEAPRVEKLVIESMMACDLLETRIKRHYKRLRYFRFYLSTIDEETASELREGRLREDVKCSVIDEIREIETAICFQEGIEPPEEEILLSGDSWEDLESLLGVLG